jgi:tetratricopeptide (TPR) repeat protein
MRSAILLVLALTTPTRADGFWNPEPRAAERAAHVADGDAAMARAREVLGAWATPLARQQVPEDQWPCRPTEVDILGHEAIDAYEAALEIPGSDPDAAELHWRAFFAASRFANQGGEQCGEDDPAYEAELRHLDGLVVADPLDLRIPQGRFAAAIAASKLGAKGGPDGQKLFLRAVDEYEQWRRASDQANPIGAELFAESDSNEAEILMALGRLDEAIDLYQKSADLFGAEALSWFGLAVSCDRDGQIERAGEAMRLALATRPGLGRLTGSGVFFVPDGDLFYYLALANETIGNKGEALRDYKLFLMKTVGQRYLERAKDHIAALEKAGVKEGDRDDAGGLGFDFRSRP